MTITIAHIHRYPVKGLSAEALDSVDLTPSRGVPFDRRFALARASTRIDSDTPEWLPKTSFLMLMRNARLATLTTRFDGKTGVLSVLRDGKKLAGGNITTPVGRALIEDFFSAYMQAEAGGKPRLVESTGGHMFSDHKNAVLSLINLASVRDLERVAGEKIDPVRFRGNVQIEGAEPWAEFGWLDREIAIGGARLTVTERIDRCAAINVNPATGERDMNLIKALKSGFGNIDMGVYAKVIEAGTIRPGDKIVPS